MTKTYRHFKAPITPFVWACLICLVFMACFSIAVAVWLYVELSK